jgi:hypothetical protein
MAEDFFSAYLKGETANTIVPLAMQAMKLKMEQEAFELNKQKAFEEREKNNELVSRLANLPASLNEGILKSYVPQGQDKPVLDDASGSSDPVAMKQIAMGSIPQGLESQWRKPVAMDVVNTQLQVDPDRGIKNFVDLSKAQENNDFKVILQDMRAQAALDKAQRDFETKIAIAEMKGVDAKEIAKMKINGQRDVALLRAALSANKQGDTQQEKIKNDRITKLRNFQKLYFTEGDKGFLETEALISRLNSGEDFDPIYPSVVGTDEKGNATLTHKPRPKTPPAVVKSAQPSAPDKVSALKKDLMKNGHTSKSADAYIAKAKAAGKL